MTEPQIQYAQTQDGVSIAFWTLGEGEPLVYMPWPTYGHLQMEWQLPEFRQWYERLARQRKLVRYDRRGSGMSDRDVTDFGLDAHARDLEAVVNRLGLERFSLWGNFLMGPVAIAYASRHPERVSRLLLWLSIVRGADFAPGAQLQAASTLVDKDWELFAQTFAHAVLGWSAGEAANRVADLIRESVTPEVWQASVAAGAEFDVSALLQQVESPTLVLHRRNNNKSEMDAARRLASQIPDARLAIMEGLLREPNRENWEAVAAAVDDFLGEGDQPTSVANPPEPSAFRTILFTDIEGSTALTERLGDARARELLREHERIVRDALKTHGGSEVKTLGDGFMASFSSATKALGCAIAMQRAFAERNRSLPAHPEALGRTAARLGEGRAEPIRVRIGLNAGEPITEDDPDGRSDLFGTAVNMAARIASQADAGEILASNVVRELVAGKDFLFADRGDTELRGFEDPVRVYEVRWRE